MAATQRAVLESGADLGIMLDTDVDRSGVVDRAGNGGWTLIFEGRMLELWVEMVVWACMWHALLVQPDASWACRQGGNDLCICTKICLLLPPRCRSRAHPLLTGHPSALPLLPRPPAL